MSSSDPVPDEIDDSEFGDDHVVVFFNRDIDGHRGKKGCVFELGLLRRLADEYSELPGPEVETDLPELPRVTEADVFKDDEDEDDDDPEPDDHPIDEGAQKFGDQGPTLEPPSTRRLPRIDDDDAPQARGFGE